MGLGRPLVSSAGPECPGGAPPGIPISGNGAVDGALSLFFGLPRVEEAVAACRHVYASPAEGICSFPHVLPVRAKPGIVHNRFWLRRRQDRFGAGAKDPEVGRLRVLGRAYPGSVPGLEIRPGRSVLIHGAAIEARSRHGHCWATASDRCSRSGPADRRSAKTPPLPRPTFRRYRSESGAPCEREDFGRSLPVCRMIDSSSVEPVADTAS